MSDIEPAVRAALVATLIEALHQLVLLLTHLVADLIHVRTLPAPPTRPPPAG